MTRPVAITGFALWSPAGVFLDQAPLRSHPGALAAWPGAPLLSAIHPRARRPAPQAAALVQLAHALLAPRTAGRQVARDTLGLVLGSSAGSRVEDRSFQEGVAARGPGFGSPGTFVYTLSSAAAGEASLALGARGGLTTLGAGAVSGWAAVVQGAARIGRGQCEACLAGAMEIHGTGAEAADFIGLCLLEPAPEPAPGPAGGRRVSGQLGFDPDRADAPLGSPCDAWARLGEAVFSAGTMDLSATSPEGHWVRLRLC